MPLLVFSFVYCNAPLQHPTWRSMNAQLSRRLTAGSMSAQVTVYVSCYVEAQNRDAFMAVKQDLLLAFVDCVERNRAELARVRVSVGASSQPMHSCTILSVCHTPKTRSLLSSWQCRCSSSASHVIFSCCICVGGGSLGQARSLSVPIHWLAPASRLVFSLAVGCAVRASAPSFPQECCILP